MYAKAYISQLRFNYDTTTLRRYHDAFDYDGSDQNYDLHSIRLRHDYDQGHSQEFAMGRKRGGWGTEVGEARSGRSPQKPETHAEYSTEQNSYT